MDIHARILIDYSGSMGYMKGVPEYENKTLLQDGSPRIELVKKILIEDILPTIQHFNFINIIRFSSSGSKYRSNEFVSRYLYSGSSAIEAIEKIKEIKAPPIGGTPIYTAFKRFSNFLQNGVSSKKIMFIITDGDSNDVEDFDDKILDFMKSSNVECPIYIIGIDQDTSAEQKSKNLCNKSGGKYVNLRAIDYDKRYFESMLFELKSNIISSSLSVISEPKSENDTDSSSEDQNLEKESQPDTSLIPTGDYISKLEKTIEDNTNAISLIGKQLELVVSQISNLKAIDQNDEFEILENYEINLKIGRQAESYVNDYLKNILDLQYFKWNNEVTESYKPFDFEIGTGSSLRYLECKGSIGNDKSFYLSKTEWDFFLDHRENYELIFVSEVFKENLIIKIGNLFQALIEKKIVPYSIKNRKIKSDLAYFRIV
ncbi:protein NO VEIN domain-containing protein [Chryseobacterium sp. IT-36CA2]|uniref:protein NO VEIN domain-containing protein n=1 Tax=Chryseobacterium sp. IT-36CA2 TaxID=3026460 RepID=UPI0039DF938B